MEILITFLYFCFFSLLAWRNFRIALIFFVILLPSYLIRFKLGPLPSTVLELTFGSLFFVWLVKYGRHDLKEIWRMSKRHKVFFVCFDLFFLASVISIFVSDMPIPSLGEWRAYFLEPMIFFLILIGWSVSPSYQEGVGGVAEVGSRQEKRTANHPPPLLGKEGITAADLIWGLALSTLSISIYAIWQKFALGMDRTTSFFTSPNSVGLYLGPIVLLIITVIANEVGMKSRRERDPDTPSGQSPGTVVQTVAGLPRRPAIAGLLAMTILDILAIFFTKSQGAWVALAVSGVLFAFIIGYRKVAATLAIGGLVFSLFAPSLRQAILFQDQAGQNRLRLWGYTQTFLTRSPQNFILGTGVRQFFRKVQKPYYDKKIMERLIYPHNFFLNFWTEVGLLGIAAAVIMMGQAFYLAYQISKHNKILGAGLLGALTVLITHGLVDVPYFKNDLAFLFWIILATILIFYEGFYQSQTERL